MVNEFRLLVLASGRGSHAVNLIQAARDGRIAGRVVRVVSDRPDAAVLTEAKALGVPTTTLAKGSAGARLHRDAERELLGIVKEDAADLVALCGFMRLLSADLIGRVGVPILNVHPSLLPAFPGLHAQRRALEAGVPETGVTVHVVDAGMDTGPIVLQAPLAIRPDDTEQTLSERLLPLEHRLYVEAIQCIQRETRAKERT